MHFHRRLVRLIATMGFIVSATPANAGPWFMYSDWAIACDNTRRCEARAYPAHENYNDEFGTLTLTLTREAGPATPLKVALSWMRDEYRFKAGALTIKAGEVKLGGLAVDRAMTADQLKRLIPALMEAPGADLSDDKHTWTLPLAGLKAALLKMDELQGRVGTPGALVRRGSVPEASVLRPLPVPRLRGAVLPRTTSSDEKLISAIIKESKDTECFGAEEGDPADFTQLVRVSSRKVLILRLCNKGFTQEYYSAWIANARPPHTPKLVALPTLDGPIDSVLNASFRNGVMESGWRASPINEECGSNRWLWTADGFKLLEARTAPGCSRNPELRLWVAKRVGKPS